jgi:NADPH:quinone reductase-like Zn-dependent oxidoreductase
MTGNDIASVTFPSAFVGLAAHHEYVRGLGAHKVIDFNAVDFTQTVKDCDAVFDTVGGDVTQRSFAALQPAFQGGRCRGRASP